MDAVVTSVASSVIAVLLPYVTKGAEEFAHLAGEAAFEKVRALYGTLKARWAGDPESAETLTHFEQKPERYKAAVEDILQEKLSQDPDLLADLKNRLKEMGPILNIVQNLKGAEGVTGADLEEFNSGKVNISQEIDGGRNIVGAKIRRLG